MSDFQVGDKVRAFGLDGVVTQSDETSDARLRCTDRVYVQFSRTKGFVMSAAFLPDGRTADWHAEPSLVLVERPKPKLHRAWMVETNDGRGLFFHEQKGLPGKYFLLIDARPVKALLTAYGSSDPAVFGLFNEALKDVEALVGDQE